jgi:uncharacterized HAD superfamily protein
MKKEVIVFDMDDTLCKFVQPALEIVNESLGKNLKIEDLREGMWIDNMLTPEELEVVEGKIFCEEFYYDLMHTDPLTLKFRKHWVALRSKYHLQVVTARGLALGRDALRITHAWLDSKGADVHGITIVNPGDSKVKASPNNTKVFVEDSAKVTEEALNAGHKVFLITRPWNIDLPAHPNMHRTTTAELMPLMTEVLECA